ncbi:MAG: cobalamin B12-binding domain-containing protein [Nitrospirae bacterium]|nr:cobalamin B12-binding domain-containing protein [Nitrospirota bacterium]
MKVLLISVNNEKDPYPVTPIGVAYVAKALKDKNHDVCILDLCFVKDDFIAIEDSLRGFCPDIVGISIRNVDNLTYKKSIFYMPRIRNIAAFIKGHIHVPIVVGGSGFSIFPEDIMKYLEIEIGIIGEGETAFPLFVDAIGNGGDVYNIPNLCCIRDGQFLSNALQYNRLNFRPDRSLLNNRSYYELGGMANIQSKRGCPFKCAYCTYPNIEGSRLRLREPVDIVEELKEMQSLYGIDYIFFVDDIFNFPVEHAAAICEEMARSGLRMAWTCFATPMGMTAELATLMKRAGCIGVEFGSDAGSDMTLKGLCKGFAANDIAYASECCKTVDLPNAHYIIMGGPGENKATLEETFKLFDRIKPTAVIALIGARIYPNTRLHEIAIEGGVIEKGRDLLQPVFYLSSEIAVDALIQKVSEHAEQRNNWVVPGLNIRCDSDMLGALRKMGKKGPLWDMLE